jgi:hypothetical protein
VQGRRRKKEVGCVNDQDEINTDLVVSVWIIGSGWLEGPLSSVSFNRKSYVLLTLMLKWPLLRGPSRKGRSW